MDLLIVHQTLRRYWVLLTIIMLLEVCQVDLMTLAIACKDNEYLMHLVQECWSCAELCDNTGRDSECKRKCPRYAPMESSTLASTTTTTTPVTSTSVSTFINLVTKALAEASSTNKQTGSDIKYLWVILGLMGFIIVCFVLNCIFKKAFNFDIVEKIKQRAPGRCRQASLPHEETGRHGPSEMVAGQQHPLTTVGNTGNAPAAVPAGSQPLMEDASED